MKLLSLLILFISCSTFENENNDPAYRWEDDRLIVENGSSETIYYAVFEQEVLAVIDWAPVSTPENEIAPNSFTTIQAEDIFDYEDGDTIVLFYWVGSEPPYEIFKSIEIET